MAEKIASCLFLAIWASAALISPARAGEMKVLAKEVFIRHQGKRPPAAGFIAYVSSTKPVLMHCHGWEDYSGGYDDYSVSLSRENGKSWSSERVQLSNFRFYQDRDTGDLVLFLTRDGERSAEEWQLADYYRYRIELP